MGAGILQPNLQHSWPFFPGEGVGAHLLGQWSWPQVSQGWSERCTNHVQA